MVHLSPSLTLAPPPDLHHLTADELTVPRGGSADGEGAPEQTEVYPGYEGYIENGLICLKHKVRNLEKKKLKLEEYKLRLKRGLVLNKDQLASVEKYEEVLHHLSLAQELHRTLDSLTHNLLRAQRKAVRKQQVQWAESERRRLGSVLQVQHVLRSLDRDRVRSDLVSGLNRAPKVPAQTLQSLRELSPLLGLTRDHALSVSAQMERAAGLFLDLLDGKDSPEADDNFASLKEELRVLVLCPYFSDLPPEPDPSEKSSPLWAGDASKCELPESSSAESSEPQQPPDPAPAPVQTWDSDRGAERDQEPPDHWDSEFTDRAHDKSPTVGKPWRGGAALVLKTQAGARRPGEGKRKERRTRREEPSKPCVDLQMPVEVLTLPTEPELRRRRLEELLTNVNGAFSFVQDSVLDGDGSPSGAHHRLRRRASGSPSPLGKAPGGLPSGQSALRSPGEPLSKALHSTPLPRRLRDHKSSLLNGDHSLDSSDLEPQDVGLVSNCETFPLFSTEPSVSAVEHKRPLQSPVSVKPPLSRTPPMAQSFTTPPSRRALPSTHFNMNTVFKVNPTLPPTDFTEAEHRPRFSSISTQTPPEFDTSDEESHEVHDYFLSPSQSGGRPAHYQRPRARTKAVWSGAYVVESPCYRSCFHPATGPPKGGWSTVSLDSSLELRALDSGHGASLSAPPLSSSGSVEESLLPLAPPLAPPDAAPVLPLYPLRVAFTASRTANFAPGNLDQPIVFDQLHSNAGDTYDARIGRFTCPAHGTYVFLFHILKLAVNVPLYVNLMRNEEVMVSAYANDGAPDHETASNHAILPLLHGDQVWLRLHRGAIYGSTWKYSTFSGFLLYQD